jgi:hypothetical protein
MKKLFLIVVLLGSIPSLAADDLLNCKWENGEAIEPGVCGTLRNELSAEDNAKLHAELTRMANEQREAEDHARTQDGYERARLAGEKAYEEEQARIRQEEEEQAKNEAARVALCKKTKTRALTAKEKRSISAQVKDLLKDPDSAKFKWMRLYGTSEVETYCGLVNAKNSYGGYTGYSIFTTILVKGQAKSSILDDGETGTLAALCKEYCYEDFTKSRP